MNQGKINKWVNELLNLRRNAKDIQFLPRGFYRDLNQAEQVEVIKQYKDRVRDIKPYKETK